MARLVLTRGIPASGKSMWANNAAKMHNAKTITKDDIRAEMGITPDNWNKKKEKEVVAKERRTVGDWMAAWEEYIIVDNTHMWENNPHVAYYTQLAKDNWYGFDIKDFPVTREEAIKRDLFREKTVGVSVIDKIIMQWRWTSLVKPDVLWVKLQSDNPIFVNKIDDDREKAFIFDIDGTLAFMNWWRSPHAYTEVGQDAPNPMLIYLLDVLVKHGHHIIILSWREDSCKQLTEDWLSKHKISYHDFYMRKEWDTRNDAIVKKEIYEKHVKKNYNVIGVFDDRDRVVKMWREIWLPCYQVYYGDF